MASGELSRADPVPMLPASRGNHGMYCTYCVHISTVALAS